MPVNSHLLSVAPMMDWTDRHCRYFLRQISRHALLYTEMVTTGAILRGRDPERFLRFHPDELPLVIQLGGDDPVELARCARVAQDWHYTEINLNVGCPSPRVQSGSFGACLMKAPVRVAEMVSAMRAASALPVTVKHRLGVDEMEDYDALARFVDTVARAGCRTFVIHARKAWLQGLSPAENRSVPPLRYDWVHRLKRDFPELGIELNGGIQDLAAARSHLAHVDGVMLGRAVYQDPWLLARADGDVFAREDRPALTRRQVIERMRAYAEEEFGAGRVTTPHRITRHMLGLFHGVPGARAWKRFLSAHAHEPGAGPAVLAAALRELPAAILDTPAGDASIARCSERA